MPEPVKVLLIDDNKADAVLVQETLKGNQHHHAFDIEHCGRLSQGLDRLVQSNPDIILLDLSLPDSQGIDTFIKVAGKAKQIPIIVLTGNNNEDMAILAVRKGAQDYIVKDEISSSLLVRAIYYAIERSRAEEKRRWLELKVLHAQKLESLNVLTGSVAHKLISLLTVGIGNAELALEKLDGSSIAYRNIQRVLDSANQAAETTKEMLAYSGKGRFIVNNLNLSRMITDMKHLIEACASSRVKIEYDLPLSLPAIKADVPQIQQMILNLIQNASEGIGGSDGTVTVKTSVVEADDKWLHQSIPGGNIGAGMFVCLEILDNGIGISAEDLSRVYEPFFTTKFSGRGLGLAAVQGIVRGHEGMIEIASEPGQGTAVTVLLPSSEKLQARAPLRNLPHPQELPVILLVEDNENIVQITRPRLEEEGFQVISVKDKTAAVQRLREKKNNFSLVMLDIPELEIGLHDTIRRIYHYAPDVRILLTSDYSEENSFGQLNGLKVHGIIRKPYRWNELKALIRKAVETEGP